MRFTHAIITIPLLLALTATSHAADFIEVTKTLKLNASVDKVWQAVGDFCAIQDWHPAIEKCQSYDDHGTLYRTLTLDDGATISEKHAGKEATSYSYFIKKSPLPVKTYKASFMAAGDASNTTITWTARFKAKGATDVEAKSTIEGIFDAGLASIAESFK